MKSRWLAPAGRRAGGLAVGRRAAQPGRRQRRGDRRTSTPTRPRAATPTAPAPPAPKKTATAEDARPRSAPRRTARHRDGDAGHGVLRLAPAAPARRHRPRPRPSEADAAATHPRKVVRGTVRGAGAGGDRRRRPSPARPRRRRRPRRDRARAEPATRPAPESPARTAAAGSDGVAGADPPKLAHYAVAGRRTDRARSTRNAPTQIAESSEVGDLVARRLAEPGAADVADALARRPRQVHQAEGQALLEPDRVGAVGEHRHRGRPQQADHRRADDDQDAERDRVAGPGQQRERDRAADQAAEQRRERPAAVAEAARRAG